MTMIFRSGFVLINLIMMINLTTAFTTYYLNQAIGNDANSGTDPNNAFASVDTALDALIPGDTLLIVGELTNPSYDPSYAFADVSDPHLWHAENTFKLNNIEGTSDEWITISGYDASTVIKGDGANIVRLQNSAYIRIINLNIYGEVLNIPYSTAKALQFVYRDDNDDIQYRVDPSLTDEEIGALTLPLIGSVTRPSYTDTRGFYASDCHHLDVIGNTIVNMPGGGLRVASSEYVDVIENEITNTSRKSYSGTHALVLTNTNDNLAQENDENYRARVIRNIVHHNYNEIYSWVGTKTFITPHIDEGKGISLQRNAEFTNGGRILVANNIAYWNGFSGVHSNYGMNIDFIHNTVYMNSFTNSITYQNTAKNGKNVGISLSYLQDCSMINNIAVIDNTFIDDPLNPWFGYALSADNILGPLTVSSNIVYGIGGTLQKDPDLVGIADRTIETDPLFAEYVAYNDFMLDNSAAFALLSASPAIGNAYPGFVPCQDHFAKHRMNYTIGAITINSDSYNVSPNNSESYLQSCYSWTPNATFIEEDTLLSSYTFESKAIEDGSIRYFDDDFQGLLDFVVVKHPTGSDLIETHLRFQFATADVQHLIGNDTNCEISKMIFKMKSMEKDLRLTDDLLVYLADGSSTWTESQSDTSGVPATVDAIGMLASAPINLTADAWRNIELNESLMCMHVLDCANLLDINVVYSWDIIVSATYDSGLLQFYSRESNPNNTAKISFQIECNNTIITTASPTRYLTNYPTTQPISTSYPSEYPTKFPTLSLTFNPSDSPIIIGSPTKIPTVSPSNDPSVSPTQIPSIINKHLFVLCGCILFNFV